MLLSEPSRTITQCGGSLEVCPSSTASLRAIPWTRGRDTHSDLVWLFKHSPFCLVVCCFTVIITFLLICTVHVFCLFISTYSFWLLSDAEWMICKKAKQFLCATAELDLLPLGVIYIVMRVIPAQFNRWS